MAIKPVDFQVAIPRTTEASKVGSNEANRNQALQQQAANTVRHKADDSLKQVYSRTKPEDAQIREKQDQQKKDGKRKQGKRQEDGSRAEDKSAGKEIKTSTIDIKI